ncbi:MAG: hypothetical protein WC266_01175 [Patescibacteria group bacterium]
MTMDSLLFYRGRLLCIEVDESGMPEAIPMGFNPGQRLLRRRRASRHLKPSRLEEGLAISTLDEETTGLLDLAEGPPIATPPPRMK